MKATRNILAAAVASALLGLTACGGSSGTDSSASTQDVVGTITGFGSVFVNGVEYETDGATVEMEGRQADEQQLKVGMVVRLRARVNADGTTGVADFVTFADEVEGLVLATSLTAGVGTLNVMGQVVQVTADTVFESELAGVTSPDGIIAGQHLCEVSGYADGSGNVYATRLELKKQHQAGDEMEVKGVVSALDAAASTFRLGDLIVDYSSAQSLPELAEGQYVEAKTESAPVADGARFRITATHVELERNGEREMRGESGEEAELAGVVTGVDLTAGTFALSGQTIRVRALPADEAEDDGDDDVIDLSLLAVGDFVEIEGSYDADGVFVAEEIETGLETDAEYEGPVEAVDAASGTVTVLGQTFRVTARTRVQDRRDENGNSPEFYFNLGDLAVGDYVEIDAATDANGQRVATALEREDDDGQGGVGVHGLVESESPLVIAGVAVDLTAAVVEGAPMLGAEAEVAGTFDGTVLTADEASFE